MIGIGFSSRSSNLVCIADDDDQIGLVMEVEMGLVRCSWLFGLVSDD